ncbi:MAG: hypothetical protein JST54_24555 [Deltaproteobacteria bacterium]|nr:hypothetical protein [Deltaproteobacteria bacterium]
MRHPIRWTVLGAVLLAAGPAFASSVFLNGVQVDGLANQKLTNATVTFDAQGNVHIEAPGIEVKTMGGGQAQPQQGSAIPAAGMAPARPSKHYFLVPQQVAVGMTGYDIDVFINGTWVTRFRGAEESNPVDVSKYVVAGPNKVLFTARKGKGERKSFSPQHTFTVMVGEGTAGGDQVIIDNPLLTFKRAANEAEDITEEFNFTGR